MHMRTRFAAFSALLLFSGSASPVMAQFKQAPQTRAEVQYSFAPIVKRAAPAVVNVYVKRRIKRRYSPFFDDPFFRRFFGGDVGVPRERMEKSLGSGVIVSADGVVVTSHHVIKGRGKADIKIALADKREFSAEVLLEDERTDLAVLRIGAPGGSFPFLEFKDSDQLEVGDLVLAIGNPFGVGQTVTSGIVSALARTQIGVSDYQFFIQTDAAINPGNSGGALIDMGGRLAGVNTAIYSRSGGSHGIGFAIPANMVRLVVQSARNGNRVQRPWFGAELQKLTPDIAASLGMDRPVGAMVAEVPQGSPAAKAGLRPGDVIMAVEGKQIADPRAFKYRFVTKGVGGKVVLDIVRDGRPRRIDVALETAPENPPRNTQVLAGLHPFDGAEIANLSPAFAEELSMQETQGVVVTKVPRRSTARSIGLRKGDIIHEINGVEILSVRQLADLVNRPARLWRLSILRKGRLLETVVGG